jgi:hypothetical protein
MESSSNAMRQLVGLLLGTLLVLAGAGAAAADTGSTDAAANGQPASSVSQYLAASSGSAANSVPVTNAASVLPSSDGTDSSGSDAGTVSLNLDNAPTTSGATVSSNPGGSSSTAVPATSAADTGSGTAPHLVAPSNTYGIDAGGSARKEVVSLVDTQSGVNRLGTSGEQRACCWSAGEAHVLWRALG